MSEFSTVALSSIAQLLSGGTPSKSESSYWHGAFPWLTPKDMGSWNGTTEETVTELAIGNGTRLAPVGSIFIAVRGMSLHNEIRIIRSNQPLTFNQDIKAVVPIGGIDGRFLYYALTAKKNELLDAVEAAGHGTGRLPTDKLQSVRVPDVPLSTQEAIVDVLCAFDDKVEVNRQMNDTLEAMAQLIFKDWFVDFGPVYAKMEGRASYLALDLWSLFPDVLNDHGIPDGWEAKPLDQIATFLNGLALQKYPATQDKFLPVIKIAQLRSGDTAGSDRAATDIPRAYVVQDGDVLFSWSGSLLHRVWTGGPGALNQHLFKVASDECPKWFFFHWIGHHMEGFRATAASKATTMGHIQRHHLAEARTVVPSSVVMKAADEVIGPFFDRAVANELEARTLATMRDLLLPKLLSGEIGVKEAQKVAEAVL